MTGMLASVMGGGALHLAAPVLRTYQAAGATTDVAPAGAVSVTIEIWGPGGDGGNGFSGQQGGNGGGGGYSRSVYAISGGQTISYSLNTGGSTAVSSGTLAVTTMTAAAGTNGTNATSGVDGTDGHGGTGSGGNQTNVTGSVPNTQAGVYANTSGVTAGQGGLGHTGIGAGTSGLAGMVAFRYS